MPKTIERYFEEFDTGESISIDGMRTITEADVVNFAGVSGDFSRLHMSQSYAEESSYGQRVPHGNLIFAITEGIAVEPNTKAVASYGHDHLRYVNPASIGDTLSVRREVVDTDDFNDEWGMVTFNYETLNQHDETLLVNDHHLLIEKGHTK